MLYIDSSIPQAHFQLGVCYVKLQNYQYAVRVLSRAIVINQRYIAAYGFRGIAYARLKKYDEAIKDYDQAIYLKPDYAKAYKFRGLARIETGNNLEAMKDLQKAAGLFFSQAQIAEHQEVLALTKKIKVIH